MWFFYIQQDFKNILTWKRKHTSLGTSSSHALGGSLTDGFVIMMHYQCNLAKPVIQRNEL